MFALTWLGKVWRTLATHPAVVSGWVFAISVVLGLLYQYVYYAPLDIPVFQLSTLNDFALIGVRSLVLLFLTALLSIVLIVLIVCTINVLTIGVLRVLFYAYSFLSISVLSGAWSGAIHTGSGVRLLACWIIYKPGHLSIGYLARLLSLLGSKRSGPQMNVTSNNLKRALEDKQRTIRGTRDDRIKRVKSVRQNLKALARNYGKQLHQINWKNINKSLNDKGYPWFIASSALLVLILNFGMASVTSSWVYDHEFHSDDKFDSSNPAACPPESTREQSFFQRYLRTYSEVELRLRDNANETRYLLQVGGTNDYVLFWRKQCCNNKGEPMIVPRGTISRIIPDRIGNPKDPDCEPKDPIQECACRNCCSDDCQAKMNNLVIRLDLLLDKVGLLAKPSLISNDIQVDIANRLQISSKDGPIPPPPKGSRESVVAVLTFDKDAKASEWFTNESYRNCEEGGSRALCIATRQTDYQSKYKPMLVQLIGALKQCGSPEHKARLQVVGYYSSAVSAKFFNDPQAQTRINESASRKDFLDCLDGASDEPEAFNICVAKDRARGVEQMLRYMVADDSLQITSNAVEQPVSISHKTTFPDVRAADRIYDAVVGRLNRRVDLILAETPLCKFADGTT